MAHHDVQIQVTLDDEGNPNFTYSPAVLWVFPVDTVSWVSNDGPFGVLFKHTPPTKEVRAQGVASDGESDGKDVAEQVNGDDETWRSEPVQIRGEALGHYHYAVAISLEGDVFLDAACPEVIVKGR